MFLHELLSRIRGPCLCRFGHEARLPDSPVDIAAIGSWGGLRHVADRRADRTGPYLRCKPGCQLLGQSEQSHGGDREKGKTTGRKKRLGSPQLPFREYTLVHQRLEARRSPQLSLRASTLVAVMFSILVIVGAALFIGDPYTPKFLWIIYQLAWGAWLVRFGYRCGICAG